MIFESTHRKLRYTDAEFNLHRRGESLGLKPIHEVRLQSTNPFVCLSLNPAHRVAVGRTQHRWTVLPK
jgi:hypothetical protein